MSKNRSDQSWMQRYQPSPHDALDASGSFYNWRAADKRHNDMLRPAFVAAIVVFLVALIFFAAWGMWLPFAIVGLLGICLGLTCLIAGRSGGKNDA